MTTTFLTIPGWNGSGPGHWQTIWEQEDRTFRRVEQRDWNRPTQNEWLDAIARSVEDVSSPVILVAHSLGCLAVALWASKYSARKISEGIRGALLVAPPWITVSDECPKELTGFLPMPTNRLPFPSILAASENDPYLPSELGTRLANAWGSEFVDLGPQGHVNIASGHGPWPEGKQLLAKLAANVSEVDNCGAVAKR